MFVHSIRAPVASKAVRNAIGERAHLRPCPAQLVLPDKAKGREVVRRRVIPLFEDTPVLAGLLTGRVADKKLSAITLTNGSELGLGYATAPASIASDPQGWTATTTAACRPTRWGTQ